MSFISSYSHIRPFLATSTPIFVFVWKHIYVSVLPTDSGCASVNMNMHSLCFHRVESRWLWYVARNSSQKNLWYMFFVADDDADISVVSVDNSTLPLLDCFRFAQMSTWSLNHCIGERLAIWFAYDSVPNSRCFSINFKIHIFPFYSCPILYQTFI